MRRLGKQSSIGCDCFNPEGLFAYVRDGLGVHEGRAVGKVEAWRLLLVEPGVLVVACDGSHGVRLVSFQGVVLVV